MIPKEDALFKTRPIPKVNVLLRWIFSKSSQIKTNASGLSYELSVNGEKRVNGSQDFINKNGHSIFYTGKSRNFNSSRLVI